MRLYELTSSQANTATGAGQAVAGGAVAHQLTKPAVKKALSITREEVKQLLPQALRRSIKTMSMTSIIGKALYIWMLYEDGKSISDLWKNKDSTVDQWQFTLGDVLMDVAGLILTRGWTVAALLVTQLERSIYYGEIDRHRGVVDPELTGVFEHDILVDPVFVKDVMQQIHERALESAYAMLKELVATVGRFVAGGSKFYSDATPGSLG